MSDINYGSGPVPPPPSVGGGTLATWGQRVVAWLLEFVIVLAGFIVVFIVSAILGAIADPLGTLVRVLGDIALACAGLYFAYLNGATGQSPGKRLTGLKVVSEATGQPIGGGLGIVRAICHIVDAIICYIGFLFPLWDPKRQTLADKIMKTVVISGLPGQPFGPALFK